MKRDAERSQAIECEKQLAKCIQREMAEESIQKQLAKRLQHEENLKFGDYTQTVKDYKDALQLESNVANCQRMSDEIESRTAAEECGKQKQALNEMQKV